MPQEDPRRRFLLRALAAGWLLAGSGWQSASLASVLGERPRRLPKGKSVFAVQGEVTVDGVAVTRNTTIAPGQLLQTGAGSQLVFVVGQDALLLRENSRVELKLLAAAQSGARHFFQLVNGAMLAVFARRDANEPIEVHTSHVYLGVRGTGLYVEAREQETYACLCYGRVQFTLAGQTTITEELQSQHHDVPRRVRDGVITPAPFINHTDAELMLLEALVGREVPFGLVDDPYVGPSRGY